MIIKKISIKGLWGHSSLEWNVNSDVAILSGINGSGKSTVVRGVASLIKGDPIDDTIISRFNELSVTFSDGVMLHAELLDMDIEALKNEAKTNDKLNSLLKKIESNKEFNPNLTQLRINAIKDGEKVDAKKYVESVRSNLVATFDSPIPRLNEKSKFIEYLVRASISELDLYLDDVIDRYKTYQIELSTKMSQMMADGSANVESVAKLFGAKNDFMDVFDSMFKESGKRINREKGDLEIIFESDGKSHSYSDLSAGEKQLLLILLTVFMQGGEEAILLMDEPEISLHIDWQSMLLEKIRALNPNCQVIVSTHSPSMILHGWHNHVSNISDLIF